jgi:hypothetical protein
MNKFVIYVFFLVSLAFFTSCDGGFRDFSETEPGQEMVSPKPEPKSDDLVIQMDKKTFEEEYSAWKSQNIVSYQFTHEFFNDAGAFGPVKITIRDSVPLIIENLNEHNDSIIAQNITGIYEFINSTFDFIESVRNGTYNGFKIKNLTLTIKYNKQYHYPTEVDFFEDYEEIVDGGGYYTLKISNFVK